MADLPYGDRFSLEATGEQYALTGAYRTTQVWCKKNVIKAN